MNQRTTSLMRARAIALAALSLGMLGMTSVALAQTGTTAASSTGVTNVTVPRSAAPAAQAAVTQSQQPGNAALTPPASNRVGDATSHLLKLQAEGQYASRNAYPMTSDAAQRTYARYLESFTHKIPESSETQVGNKSGR